MGLPPLPPQGHGCAVAAKRFMNTLQMVARAVSLGDAESLAQHPASMTHSTYTPEQRAAHGISEGLVRISAGLEDEQDLLADVLQALNSVVGTNAVSADLRFSAWPNASQPQKFGPHA